MSIIAQSGNTTEVYPFKVYSAIQDEYIQSTRFATSRVIESINGVRIGPSISVPNEDVTDGFTEKHYQPK